MEKQKIVFIGVLVVLLMSGCKQEQLVEKPELYIEASSQRLKFGEEFTIRWVAENATRTENNFCTSSSIQGSYSERLIESKTFWVQAFNEEGISTLRRVNVIVEPNENDLQVILLKYSWPLVNVDKDLGADSLGIHSWFPYTIIPDRVLTFNINGSYFVARNDGTVFGRGESYTWTLDKDKMILTLSGKEYKVLSLTKDKMELYSFITTSFFKDTYRTAPKL